MQFVEAVFIIVAWSHQWRQSGREEGHEVQKQRHIKLVRMGRTHEDRKTPLVSCCLQTLRFNDVGVLQKMLEPFVMELDIKLAQEHRN